MPESFVARLIFTFFVQIQMNDSHFLKVIQAKIDKQPCDYKYNADIQFITMLFQIPRHSEPVNQPEYKCNKKYTP